MLIVFWIDADIAIADAESWRAGENIEYSEENNFSERLAPN